MNGYSVGNELRACDSPTVLGIDPGGRQTGIVIRRGDDVIHYEVLDRQKDESLEAWCWRNREHLKDLGRTHSWNVEGVEGLNVPNPHMAAGRGTKVLAAVMETAAVFGAVVYPDSVVIPPKKNGSRGRDHYPAVLWGPREGPAGTGRLRHARSAWDVAGKAVQ